MRSRGLSMRLEDSGRPTLKYGLTYMDIALIMIQLSFDNYIVWWPWWCCLNTSMNVAKELGSLFPCKRHQWHLVGKGMSRLTIIKEREEKMIHDMQERVLEQMELRDSGGTGLLRICWPLFGVLPFCCADPITCHQVRAASEVDNLLHPNLQDVIATNERLGRPCGCSVFKRPALFWRVVHAHTWLVWLQSIFKVSPGNWDSCSQPLASEHKTCQGQFLSKNQRPLPHPAWRNKLPLLEGLCPCLT